jgi:hypothetical protein
VSAEAPREDVVKAEEAIAVGSEGKREARDGRDCPSPPHCAARAKLLVRCRAAAPRDVIQAQAGI